MKSWRNFYKSRRTKMTFTKFCFYYILPVIGILGIVVVILGHNGYLTFGK
ncbi:MAG: hypothetical protein Q8888_02440 [Vigna little leaf phytoplasma]|nr:hypothetical protein [Vigna little leaf phytoplasma]